MIQNVINFTMVNLNPECLHITDQMFFFFGGDPLNIFNILNITSIFDILHDNLVNMSVYVVANCMEICIYVHDYLSVIIDQLKGFHYIVSILIYNTQEPLCEVALAAAGPVFKLKHGFSTLTPKSKKRKGKGKGISDDAPTSVSLSPLLSQQPYHHTKSYFIKLGGAIAFLGIFTFLSSAVIFYILPHFSVSVLDLNKFFFIFGLVLVLIFTLVTLYLLSLFNDKNHWYSKTMLTSVWWFVFILAGTIQDPAQVGHDKLKSTIFNQKYGMVHYRWNPSKWSLHISRLAYYLVLTITFSIVDSNYGNILNKPFTHISTSEEVTLSITYGFIFLLILLLIRFVIFSYSGGVTFGYLKILSTTPFFKFFQSDFYNNSWAAAENLLILSPRPFYIDKATGRLKDFFGYNISIHTKEFFFLYGLGRIFFILIKSLYLVLGLIFRAFYIIILCILVWKYINSAGYADPNLSFLDVLMSNYEDMWSYLPNWIGTGTNSSVSDSNLPPVNSKVSGMATVIAIIVAAVWYAGYLT